MIDTSSAVRNHSWTRQIIRPVYHDLCFGPLRGSPMEVNGKPLKNPEVKHWLLELMEGGEEYETAELVTMVQDAHVQAGGLRPNAKHERAQISKALGQLQASGHVENIRIGWWALNLDAALPDFQEAESAALSAAEVDIGQGRQVVYGWYLPAYRELAEINGKSRYPIKVGRSERNPEARVSESGGTLPERPVVGFVLRVESASQWERLLHARLSLRGQRIETAVGNEWFSTSIDELRDLAAEELANIERAHKEESSE